MADIIRLTTEAELEALHAEVFINTTNKVTKVTDESTLRGLIRGNVRTGKAALKDIALAVFRLFVDKSSGATLDEVADDHGIAPRFAAAQSSTYVRLIAANGTVYTQGVHTVSDNKGNIFDLQASITIGTKGYGYVKVRSQQSGSSTRVDPYTIINISPVPSGHVGVINEYGATGGIDAETDDTFRQRIKEGPDLLARDTLSYLTQVLMKINSNVLRIIYEGVSVQGKVILSVLTVNGIDLTTDELQALLDGSAPYLALTEMAPVGTQSLGVTFKNSEYHPVDVSMRLELFSGESFDAIVKEIQQKFAKYVDFRFWNSAIDKIEWDSLLGIVKNVKGVKYVPDSYFSPNVDISILPRKFPRFRGFEVKDLSGNIIINQAGTLDPIFYPNEVSLSLTETVL